MSDIPPFNGPNPPLYSHRTFNERIPRDLPKPKGPPWILIVGVLIAVGILIYLASL